MQLILEDRVQFVFQINLNFSRSTRNVLCQAINLNLLARVLALVYELPIRRVLTQRSQQ